MTQRAQKLIREALELPLNERAEVAAELLASIDGEPDSDAEAAWATEVERRARRAIAGESVGSDWTDVRARIEAQLAK